MRRLSFSHNRILIKLGMVIAVLTFAAVSLFLVTRAEINTSSYKTASQEANRRVLRAGRRAPAGAKKAPLSTFVVTNTDDSGAGSLRQAILDANGNAGADMITFQIGSGAQTISPTSELPHITDAVTIDATTQTGFSGTPIIELNGASAGPAAIGLVISAGNSTVRGLVINRFAGGGIQTHTNGDNTIQCNYVGTNIAGTAALGNGGDGISINGDNNTIGGTTLDTRNVISGNVNINTDGINISGSDNIVQGNFIGTNAAGTGDIGNRMNGIFINTGQNNMIGGTVAGARNVISGNDNIGVAIGSSSTSGNIVQGNFIGTAVDGVTPLGNVDRGIALFNATNNTIGGSAPGTGNTIAFNGGSGVQISSGTGNLIRGNSIHSNNDIGIDLGFFDGVTPNDTGDGDTGPNNLQNFPVLIDAINNGVSTTIRGTLNSAANTQFVVEFFSNTMCDSSLHGEGATPLGSTMVTTDGNGIAAIEAALATAVPAGQLITSIATDPGNNSSEFSACVKVCASITFSPLALSQGTVGTAYNQTITASGGAAPYGFAVSVGSLPAGLTLSAGGVLTGTPTTPGSFTFTATATDAGGCTGNRSYTVIIALADSCAESSFDAAVNYGAVAGPLGIAMGDFNSDGKLDLAATNRDSNVVSIYLNTGTGGFGAASNFPSGSSPTAVAVRDFNSDGKADLAVTNLGGGNVSILLGTGTGSFGMPVGFDTAMNPIAVAIGDFNSDGKLDLAVVNNNSDNVSILLGTGTGSFGAAVNIPVGLSPTGVAIGDFNSDGKADLAVSNFFNNNVAVMLGTGTGSFNPLVNYPVGGRPIDIATGDFNNDGNSDLVTANYNSSNISILLGDGMGSFDEADNLAVGPNPRKVAVGDVNGDGINDLAVTKDSSDIVSTLPGTGTGSFSPPLNFDVGDTPSGVAIGDLSGDGKLDLAVANFISTNVSVLLNNCCTASFPITPFSRFFAGTGGEGSVKVTASSNCSWQAASNASWITITSAAAGTGNGAVTYLVRENLTPLPRAGTLTIAGQTFTVTQDSETAPACAFAIAPLFSVVEAIGGTGSINVTAGAACAWQATSDVSWITITPDCCGIGNGAITYTVEPNASGAGRNGVITVAGQKFNVKQK